VLFFFLDGSSRNHRDTVLGFPSQSPNFRLAACSLSMYFLPCTKTGRDRTFILMRRFPLFFSRGYSYFLDPQGYLDTVVDFLTAGSLVFSPSPSRFLSSPLSVYGLRHEVMSFADTPNPPTFPLFSLSLPQSLITLFSSVSCHIPLLVSPRPRFFLPATQLRFSSPRIAILFSFLLCLREIALKWPLRVRFSLSPGLCSPAVRGACDFVSNVFGKLLWYFSALTPPPLPACNCTPSPIGLK